MSARKSRTVLVNPSRPDIKQVVKDMNEQGYVYAGKRNGMAVYTLQENKISDMIQEHYFMFYSLVGIAFILVAIAILAILFLA